MSDKYRDELVEQIRLVGQELIDRAEEMVAPDMNMIADFSINIVFAKSYDHVPLPEISWSTMTYSKNVLHNLRCGGKEKK